MASTYKIKLTNCPINASFMLEIAGVDHIVGGGSAKTSTFIFDVPSEYQGEGRIRVNIPSRTRTYSSIAFPLVIKANGKDIEIDLTYYVQRYTPGNHINLDQDKPVSSKKKLLVNDLKEKVQAKKKSVADIKAEIEADKPAIKAKPKRKLFSNKLQEEVQSKAVDSETETENNEVDKDGKKSFWDRIK